MALNPTITTRTPVEEHRFTWKVANFAQIRNCRKAIELQQVRFNTGKNIGVPVNWRCFLLVSTTYSTNKFGDTKWLQVCLAQDQPNSVVTAQNAENELACEVFVSFRVKIGDNGSVFNKCTAKLMDKRMAMEKCECWTLNQVIFLSENPLTVPLDSSGSLSLNTEVSMLNVSATSTHNDVPLSSLTAKFDTKFCKTLKNDLLNTLKNPEPPSAAPMLVKIVSSDGMEFSVNRGILAARSPVFMSMFQQKQMTEVQKGVVKIEDISEALLVFMHTGTLSENWSEPGVIEEFTYAAHKYMLEDLQEFLNQALRLVCTVQNCGKLLSLAVKLNMKQAENDLMEFSLKGHRLATNGAAFY